MSTRHDPFGPHVNAAREYRDGGTLIEIASSDDPRTMRARFLAAQNMKNDPEKRKEMEATYGKEFCRTRYPEAYFSDGTQIAVP